MKLRFAQVIQPLRIVLLVGFSFSAGAQGLELLSTANSTPGPQAGGSGDSQAPVLSRDGRFVLFASTANNLVALGTNPVPEVNPPPLNVFLRDRTNGTTTLISVNSAGTGGGNDNSWPIAISTNGQFVLFESNAGNLVAGDTNNATDVFVRDVVNGFTLLVSVSTNGAAANGPSRGSAMTPDGRYVAFQSAASNLVTGDTNAIPDVFVRDLQTGQTTLVSVGARANSYAGPKPVTALSAPEITPDGRYVVFTSVGTNLVSGVTNSSGSMIGNEVYVRDLVQGTTTWASSGAQPVVRSVFGTYFGAVVAAVFDYAISDDGQFVVYEASPASPGWAVPGGYFPAAGAVLRYSLWTGLTDVVHTNTMTGPWGDNRHLDISADGRFIAFVANTNGPPGAGSCILLWDAMDGTNTLVSGDLNNQAPVNSRCDWPRLDPTGRFVAFVSSGLNLVTNSLAGNFHLYVRDTQTGTTALVDADTNNVGAVLITLPVPSLSDDGRFVAFEAPGGRLVPNDSNRNLDVFVRDLAGATTELVSAHAPALPSSAADGPSILYSACVSFDGRYVTFASSADNLVPNDTNAIRDIFVRDLALGTNTLLSTSTNGSPGDGLSSESSLTGDGRFAVFTSSADNLVPADSNKAQDVFVRDLQAGTTTLVSVNSSGTGSGNLDSHSPLISTNDRYVLFLSKASNLAPGTFGGGDNLFLRDLQAGTTTPLTYWSSYAAPVMTPDGHYVVFAGFRYSSSASGLYVWDSQAAAVIYTNTSSIAFPSIALSPDGRRVLYWVSSGLNVTDLSAHTNGLVTTIPVNLIGIHPGLRFSADGRFLTYAAPLVSQRGTNQVYLFDFQTASNFLVSQSSTGQPANGNSDSPEISPDGRFIAYRSDAANIAPAGTNGVPQFFLFDRQTGITTLLSTSRFGSYAANNRSRAPSFSGNSQTLVFESWAADLVDQTFNFNGNVFAFNLYGSSPIVLFQAAITPAAQGSWLSWPVVPGKTYQVQFKNNLSDPQWQDLAGNITIVGNTGYLQDLAPGTTQRFYRIAAF